MNQSRPNHPKLASDNAVLKNENKALSKQILKLHKMLVQKDVLIERMQAQIFELGGSAKLKKKRRSRSSHSLSASSSDSEWSSSSSASSSSSEDEKMK